MVALLDRPPRLRFLAWVGSAIAIPLVYEVFRAGYYGLLVPMPAITKEAGESLWSRGFQYVTSTLGTYWLVVPLVVAAGLLADMVMRRQRSDQSTVILIAAPVVSGALLMLYVIKVGGDFMHARMLLVPLLLLVLPTLVMPARAVTLENPQAARCFISSRLGCMAARKAFMVGRDCSARAKVSMSGWWHSSSTSSVSM